MRRLYAKCLGFLTIDYVLRVLVLVEGRNPRRLAHTVLKRMGTTALLLLSIALLPLSVFAYENHPNRTNWTTESIDFVSNGGTFNCSGCHNPNQENTALKLTGPANVPRNEDTVDVNLIGFRTSSDYSGLRYRTTGSTVLIINARTYSKRTISVSPTADPVDIRYCMVDAIGSTMTGARYWHCTTLSIPRAPNNAPQITSTVPGTQNLQTEGDAFIFTVTATDDTDTPTISVSSSNDSVVSVTTVGSGTYSLKPEAVGSNVTITIEASDGELSDAQTFLVNVAAPVVENAAPTITSSNPGTQTLQLGEAGISLTATAADDVAVTNLSVTANNDNISITGPDISGQYMISPEAAGTSVVTIEASDGELTATQMFTVVVNQAPTIRPVNAAPSITSSNPGSQSLTIGADPLTLTLKFFDEFPDVTTVNLTSTNPDVVQVTAVTEIPTAPPGIIQEPLPSQTEGERTFTLSPMSAGTSTLRFLVTDNVGNEVTQEFEVVVSPGNKPPQFELVSTLTLVAAESTRIELAIQDEDTDSVEIDVDIDNSDIVSVDILGNTAITINALRVGETSVTVTVEDEQDVDATATVLVTVISSNQAPEAVADEFVLSPGQNNIRLDVLANDKDPEGGALTIMLEAPVSVEGVSLSVVDDQVSYQLSGDLTADDSFSYRVRDAEEAESSAVRVALSPSDLDNDERVDALDNCPLLPNPDQQDRDSDNIGDLCDPDPDGESSQPFESGKELVEAECLACHLTGISNAPLFGDDAAWTALINSAGGLPEDLLPSVVNGAGGGTMPAFGSQYGARDLIQAIRYLSGVETSGPIVDIDSDTIDDAIDNCLVVSNTDQQDSNSNGVGDVCEPTADIDGDGYTFTLDDDDTNALRMLASTDGSNNTVYSSAMPLAIGRVAQVYWSDRNNTIAKLVLPFNDFVDSAATALPGITIVPDGSISSLMGVTNVINQASGGQAGFIVQLETNLPLSPDMRVLDTGSGIWGAFNSVDGNALASAAVGEAGCPLSGSANYLSGLVAGLPCVQVTIADGGPNDADGQINGSVELMADIGGQLDRDGSSGPEVVEINPSSSGGRVMFGSLVFLILVLTGRFVCVLRRVS